MSIANFKRIVVAEPEKDVEEPAEELAGKHFAGISPKFLFAGKCLFTLTNVNTNEQLLFKVRARQSEWPKNSGKRTTSYFLNVKAPGGKYAFRYIGLIKPDGLVAVTGKSEYKPTDKEYLAGGWAAQAIISGKPIPDNYRIEHCNRCGRCARELTDDATKTLGFDADCARILATR